MRVWPPPSPFFVTKPTLDRPVVDLRNKLQQPENIMEIEENSGTAEKVKRSYDPNLSTALIRDYGSLKTDDPENGNTYGSTLARAIFNKAVKNGSADVIMYGAMINVHYRSKQFGEALGLISNAPEKIREHPDMLQNLVDLMRKNGQYPEAIEKCDEFLGRQDLPPDIRHGIMMTKAYALDADKRTQDAIVELRKLELEMPEDSPHRARLYCGLVFFDAVTAEEAPHLKEILRDEKILRNKKGVPRRDVLKALDRLDKRFPPADAAGNSPMLYKPFCA